MSARTVVGLHVVEQAGREPAVVLVHGAMDRAAGFARSVRQLGVWRCVRYDRRGYGRSVGSEPSSELDDQVADLIAVVGDRPAVVVGHSLGAVIAVAAAARFPAAVGGLVAYEPPMPWEPWWRAGSAGTRALGEAGGDGPADPAAVAERFMRAMIGDDRWGRLPPSTRAQRRAEGPALLADLRSLRTGSAPFDLASVEVPAVVAHGSDTSDRHRRSARGIASALPDAELVVIDGAGHGAHLSHPADFAGLVQRAIARVPAERVDRPM